jgi:hypothetical protein
MVKYTFYKIHLKTPTEEQQKFNYVGMTANLIDRKSKHKHTCNNENSKNYNLNVYRNIRENGGWDNFCVEPLEELECENRLEGSKRERYWYNIEGGELNTYIPNQTKTESNAINYANNREERIELQKIYNAEHRAEIKLYMANYYIKKKQLKQEPIV